MNKREKKLLNCLRALPDPAAQQLIDFAEFLQAKYQPITTELAEPQAIPRPDQESVVAAVKRLSATYPMLDKDKLLNETSALVMQHMMQGPMMMGKKDMTKNPMVGPSEHPEHPN